MDDDCGGTPMTMEIRQIFSDPRILKVLHGADRSSLRVFLGFALVVESCEKGHFHKFPSSSINFPRVYRENLQDPPPPFGIDVVIFKGLMKP